MLPSRYRTEIRTGRDIDVEVWLAADQTLDRPVLIRQLDPTASSHRRHEFLRSVRQAASISHTHLIDVYAADQANDIAYAVLEWSGGMTIADRLEARIPMDNKEFLPNAAGLAEALDALHEKGYVHGGVDTTSIFYATAHPAKLGCFGRPAAGVTPRDDVVALAGVLQAAAGDAGSWDDDIGPHISAILDGARAGEMSAFELAEALHTAPGPSPSPPPAQNWTWRWIGPGGILVAVAVAAGILALLTQRGDESPFRVPETSTTITTIQQTTTTPPIVGQEVAVTEVSVYDPLGDGAEFDQRLPQLIDDDLGTGWRTERYFNPLSRIKAGVGIVLGVNGNPSIVSISGSPGTTTQMRWTPTAIAPESPDDWEIVAEVVLSEGENRVDLGDREGGLWLLWITEVAVQDNGEFHYSFLQEVRFSR
ncbi:MAG: protein kinase [Acidimicrobiia bacterium]|nr:protein kinase [Acidimicrobiia bacterium]